MKGSTGQVGAPGLPRAEAAREDGEARGAERVQRWKEAAERFVEERFLLVSFFLPWTVSNGTIGLSQMGPSSVAVWNTIVVAMRSRPGGRA
jgi:hypothetical protein